MVTFRRGRTEVLYAYLTSPVSLTNLDRIHAQFAIGAFARFSPSSELFIRDRPDFYSLSHLKIRQRLDVEGFLDTFLIIEDRTIDSNAVWYIDTTEAGESEEESGIEDGNIVKHGDEPTLLRIRTLIIDIGVLHANLTIANTSILETLDEWPYDPRSDQEPYTLGVDFENDESWIPAAFIAAGEEEVEVSDDLALRKKFMLGRGHPEKVIRLKPEVATREGLKTGYIGGWNAYAEPNKAGEYLLQVKYDPQSDRWSDYIPLQH
jgi:hypothetical protein